MRIIIDGNDGVGKTTLAKRIAKDLDIKSYIHLTNKDPKDFIFYRTLLDKHNVIFDRSFLSEPIYSQVLNRKSEIGLREINLLANIAKENNYVIIICHSADKIYSKGEYSEIVKNEKVIDKYFEQIAKDLNFIYYDTRKADYIALLTMLTKLKKEIA